MTTIAVTGHRPPKVGGYDLTARRALGGFAVDVLRCQAPTRVITGMALGWDQAVAGACVALRIPFVAAVPFDGQEKRWPEEAQKLYWKLLGQADEVVTVSPYPGTAALHQRNEWMVDRAEQILALWDGGIDGGTAACVAYAHRRGVPVVNVWADWTRDPFDMALG